MAEHVLALLKRRNPAGKPPETFVGWFDFAIAGHTFCDAKYQFQSKPAGDLERVVPNA